VRSSRFILMLVAILAFHLCAFAQSTTQKTYVIAGIAVDHHSGQPLAHTRVSIAPAAKQDDSRSMVTGPDGRFRFDKLTKGKYSLVGSRRGYLEQAFDQHEQYSSAIAVGDDQDSTHLVFRLHPDAAIHGRILDENGEPVAQMQVWLFSTRNDLGRRSTRMMAQTASDDLGEYSFAHLEEGTYYLLAMGKPWYATDDQPHLRSMIRERNRPDARPETPEHEQLVDREAEQLAKAYPLTFFDNVQDWTQASGIDLAPGDRFTADFRVATVPSARIRFGSLEPGSDPAQGRSRMPRIMIQARVFGDQSVPITTSFGNDDDGSFVVRGIPPGRYIVSVQNRSDMHSETQELDIVGDMELPKLAGRSGASVTGKFVWEGTPVTRGIGVALTNSHTNRNYFCMLRPDGECVVAESVQPGKYEVTVRSRLGDIYVKTVETAGVKSSSAVQINEGADANLTVTLAHGTGTIDGVAMLDGKPKAGVMVVLVPADGWVGTSRFRRDQSDSDGTFTLRNVVPGKYKVVALRDGWKLPWSDPKVMKSYLTEGTTAQINADEKAQITVKVK
jgi:hypothetical protein